LKAAVKERRGDGFVNLAEVSEPLIERSDVLVRVAAAGVFGSDLMILHDNFPS
jgi:D-arabinose 1-dehydrogenase-like Zn-dependent alcohol dehydrogenase